MNKRVLEFKTVVTLDGDDAYFAYMDSLEQTTEPDYFNGIQEAVENKCVVEFQEEHGENIKVSNTISFQELGLLQ